MAVSRIVAASRAPEAPGNGTELPAGRAALLELAGRDAESTEVADFAENKV